MPNSPNLLSVAAFLAIVVSVVTAFVIGTYVTRGKKQAFLLALAIFAWLAALAVVVGSGVLEAQPMPRVMIFVAATLVAALVLAFSQVGRSLATLPVAYSIAFQAFRLPLELVLHSWALQGFIPETMTWTGRNFDIVTGVAALLVAPFAGRSNTLAWTFNIVGFALLLNVMVVAVLSSPLPFAWNVTPPLELVFHIPYFLIVPVCVAGALAGRYLDAQALSRRAWSIRRKWLHFLDIPSLLRL